MSHHKTTNSMNKQDNMSHATISTPIIILPEKSNLADAQDNEFKKINYKHIEGTQRVWINARMKTSKIQTVE